MAATAEDMIDRLFLDARTYGAWRDERIGEPIMRRLYDALRMAPTANNSSPGRFLFVASAGGKARLEPLVSNGNRPKVRAAPVCVIIGYDLDFPDHLAKLQPHKPQAASAFAGPAQREEVAFRNGTLQGAYLIMAARAMGLDCGPMSGFDRAAVDREFFASTNIRSNFLCCIGHGERRALRPRLPRLAFEEACAFI